MDWNLAIERNRESLKRILAMLVGMAGLGISAVGNRHSGAEPETDCLLPIADCRPTLPRHLHRAILRLIRPAESAVRRLIIVMARGLVVTLPPPRPRKPKPVSIFLKKPGGTGIYLPPGARLSAPASWGAGRVRKARPLALPLLDPLSSPLSLSKGRLRPKHQPQIAIPRISFPGFAPLSPITPRLPPGPDDPLDATRLSRRLAALGAALDDLPAQAKRFARWKARKAMGKTRRVWPLRPGRPPGQLKAERRRQDVHEVLADLHYFAFEVLEHRDTS